MGQCQIDISDNEGMPKDALALTESSSEAPRLLVLVLAVQVVPVVPALLVLLLGLAGVIGLVGPTIPVPLVVVLWYWYCQQWY